MSNTDCSQSRHWRLSLSILAAVITVLLSAPAPARAITYGEPDGNTHPFVGSIVLRVPDEGLFQWCSGTLIAERVFLTASHCTAPLDDELAENPGAEVLVTFDPILSEGGTFYTGQWHTNPNYNGFQGPGGRSDPGDIAVIVLDEAPPIAPARLPTAGLLDELQASHTLNDTGFTAVGYGTVRETNRTGFQAIQDNLARNRVEQEVLSLTPAWLTLSMNLSTGNGGTCYGDSGGPHFIHLDGEETTIVASITVTGDAPCKATDVTYRTDTQSARSFLAGFVDLP
ncbi:MAG TPA: trypsin-like serine protease [Roseiflexaceae bacterium]|nr:trypsin-like serine protease [Roseiflexaceae bacterium]